MWGMKQVQQLHSVHSTMAVERADGFSWHSALALFVAMSLGVAAAWWCVPQFADLLAQSLIGAQAKGFWFLSRASGVTGYLLLWWSVLLGLLMSTRLSRNTRWAPLVPALMAVHEFVSIVSWLIVVLHGLILIGDAYVAASWFQLLVPFAFPSAQSLWIGLGQMGVYLMAVVLLSYYVRTKIGFQTWRWLHFATFALYAMVTVHALLAGSDTTVLWPMYALSNGLVLFLTVYRLLQMRQLVNS